MDLSSHVYIHHIIMSGILQQQSMKPLLIPNASCVGNYPDIQQIANQFADQFGVAAPDLTKIANSFGIAKLPDLNQLASQFSEIGTQIGSIIGSIFSPAPASKSGGAAPVPTAKTGAPDPLAGFGSLLGGGFSGFPGFPGIPGLPAGGNFNQLLIKGHEANHVQFAPLNNSGPMSGLWIGKDDKVLNSVELVNYKEVAQDVYFTMDMEYLPFDKKPTDILDVTFGGMFAADCADMMMRKLISYSKR
jgi:hypothetical protein